MTDSTETARIALRAAINTAGLTLECEPIPHRTKYAEAWKGSKGFHYRCKLTKPGGFYYQCEYSVGRGVVRSWIAENRAAARKAHRIGCGYDRFTGNSLSPYGVDETVHERNLLDDVGARIFRPDIVDVVWSLLMDQSGMSPHETFREWCERMEGDFGMTWTNPADAVDAYENARLALAFLARSFGDNLQAVTETAGEM